MNTDIINIESTFELNNISGPSVKIKDLTPYVANNIALAQVKGNIKGSYGATVFHETVSWSTPDIVRASADSKTFLLPVDSNGKVINATYDFKYTVQVTEDIVYSIGTNFNAVSGTPFTSIQLTTVTSPVVDAINALLTNPNYSSVQVRFLDAGGATLGTTTNMLGCSVGGLITFASMSLAAFADIASIIFIATSLNEKTFSYTFCNKPITPNLCVTSNCFLSQLYAKDESVYPAYLDSTTRTMVIQFPRLANGTPVETAITTANASYTVGPNIWSGNYTVSLSVIYQYTESDGLIVIDTLVAYSEQNVRCDNGLCSMAGCIATLSMKYTEAIKSGSKDAYELQQQNFQVVILCNRYMIESTCKNLEKAQAVLDELSLFLEQAGCNCGCNTQDQGEPAIIYPSIVF